MSLVHGGTSFKIMGPTMYSFMSGKDPADLIADISEVPAAETRLFLSQVMYVHD